MMGGGGMRGSMGGLGGGSGGMGMGMGGRGGAGGGDMGPGGFGGGDPNMFMAANSKANIRWIAWKDLERQQQKSNIRLADVPTPQRLVYVAGAFPYKKEVEELQTKL